MYSKVVCISKLYKLEPYGTETALTPALFVAVSKCFYNAEKSQVNVRMF